MIVRVVKPGSDLPGLAAYMWGPGKAEEHTDQRMIASTGASEIALGESVMFYRGERATVLDDRALDSSEARAEGRGLEAPWRFFREEAMVPAGAGLVASAEQGAASRDGGDVLRVDDAWVTSERQERTGWNRPHVFHVVFSLGPDEGELSDETWGRIASDYVRDMQFAGNEGTSDCRWAAWRHGKSAGGNDHMHVAVSLVREDGRWASVHRSFMKSRSIGDDLERKYGLRPVKDSESQRGMPGLSKGERRRSEQAKPDSREKVPERQRLAMIVRTAAIHAGTEKQFIADVLRQGVRVRPRFAKGTTDVVEGANFKFRDSGEAPWLAGGRLARDMTLPKLREMWDDTPEQRAAALPLWRGSESVEPEATAPSWTPSWNAAQQALATWATRIERLDPADEEQWASAGRDAATVASELAQGSGGRQFQLLAATTQELARSAQTRERVHTPAADDVRVACRHLNLLLRAGSKSDAAGWWAVWQQFSRVSEAIHAAQGARGELVRAQRLETSARTELQSVTNGLRKAAGVTPPAARAASTRTTPKTRSTTRGEERGR